jgi:hypothetical protein
MEIMFIIQKVLWFNSGGMDYRGFAKFVLIDKYICFPWERFFWSVNGTVGFDIVSKM